MKPNQIPGIGKQYWLSYSGNSQHRPNLVMVKRVLPALLSDANPKYVCIASQSGLPATASAYSLFETEREAWNAKADRELAESNLRHAEAAAAEAIAQKSRAAALEHERNATLFRERAGAFR